ncbi:hypothetical protein Ro1_00186 [Raoultella phage Ro1]|uniref:Uncharacterized protein n=1 Tax=Raoultella phage Ro1 TaxID=2053702 RepID=A0A2H4YGV0_9CAUD|nr:hypothetical protein HWB37_gp238 [Raoultella phage Ro1]AUE23391.1 hypothetical protein Ro1_00186 [Raoultella phage Ro1]
MIHTYDKNEHLREYRLLKSFFADDIYHILRSLDVMIAGGPSPPSLPTEK